MMYHHIILILAFLNLYCYSLPIPFNDPNDQEQISSSLIHMNDQQNMMKLNPNDQLHYLNFLCALYKDCDDTDQENLKLKRLTSNLFHGIPKFGKRAFTSAFSGIPKFG